MVMPKNKFENDRDAGEAENIVPVTIDEIISNLSDRNSTGRNTFKRGIRGDIEEYLGWHLDTVNDSTLTQLDRVNVLEKLRNTDFLLSSEMAESDLKKFLEEKEDELCRDEALKYLNSRQSKSLDSESAEIG